MMNRSIKNCWEQLKKAYQKKNDPPIKLDFEKNLNSKVNFLIARVDNNYGIILESEKKYFPVLKKKPLSENFEFQVRLDGKKKFYWFFLKNDNAFGQEKFEMLCFDIINKSSQINNPSSAISMFVSTIIEWQDFFKEKRQPLGKNGIQGLYAELLFMEKYLIPNIGIENAVAGWKFIEKTHDFTLNSLTVEVKSTTQSPIKKIEINSLKQLDETLVNNLYLYMVQLNSKGTDNLVTIIDRLKKTIRKNSYPSFYRFQKILLEEGYDPIFKNEISKYKFSLNKELFFLVDKKFPRLKSSDLNSNILDAKYSININNEKIFNKKNFISLLKT